MSIKTFLLIQAQKIFSLFNCPNSKYTWMLFQKYVREMILESWSLFINTTERTFYNNNIKKSYSDLLKVYLPDSDKKKDYDIVHTFMHIYNHVLMVYESTLLEAFPKNLLSNYKQTDNSRFCTLSVGFKPFTLVDKSGARINTLNNPDQELNFITDPELKYRQKQPKGYKPLIISITEKIDKIFNLICQKKLIK